MLAHNHCCMLLLLLVITSSIIVSSLTINIYTVRKNNLFSSKSSSTSLLASKGNSILIEFQPADRTITAVLGDSIPDVALANSIDIPYKCREGKCGTCLINMDGKWVQACQSKVVATDTNQKLIKILVKPQKKKAEFFSPQSFIDGVVNNFMGVIGFVFEGMKTKDAFQERIQKEKELAAKVAELKKKKKEEGEGRM